MINGDREGQIFLPLPHNGFFNTIFYYLKKRFPEFPEYANVEDPDEDQI